MGDSIKVGLKGVVFVLLLQDKAEVAAVFNTNNSVSRKGGEFADELWDCQFSRGSFVMEFMCYVLNKPLKKLHEIFSCSTGGITVRLREY